MVLNGMMYFSLTGASGQPVDVKTETVFEDSLTEANVNKVVEYTGASTTVYENGRLYLIVEESVTE